MAFAGSCAVPATPEARFIKLEPSQIEERGTRGRETDLVSRLPASSLFAEANWARARELGKGMKRDCPTRAPLAFAPVACLVPSAATGPRPPSRPDLRANKVSVPVFPVTAQAGDGTGVGF